MSIGILMTWEEIQRQYPDQWVSVEQIERDAQGRTVRGLVTAAGPDLGSVIQMIKSQRNSSTQHKFEFTGTIKPFLGLAQWTIGDAAAH